MVTTQHSSRIRVSRSIAALLFATCVISSIGCGAKNTASAPAKLGQPAKPTPEQMAAMQRAIAEGPARHAAAAAEMGTK